MIDRSRVTERISLSTVRLELKRAIKPLIVLAIGFAVAAAAGFYIVDSISGGIGGTHEMHFAIADATGIVPGRAEVRFYGIQAGQVDSAQLSHGQAILDVSVADKFGPIYRNATAAVRPNTPLNDMYLDITSRGTPTAGVTPPAYIIPLSQTTSPANLADVLNTFQPDVRTQMYNLIDQLGNGLADRGVDLKQAFIDVAPFLHIVGTLTQQLSARATLTRQLVHNTATLAQLLAARSTQIHTIVSDGTRTLSALTTRDSQPLRSTLSILPGMLNNTITLFAAADQALPTADATISALRPVASDLPQGLTNLTALTNSAEPAISRLRAPVTALVPLATQLQPFSAQLSQALTSIRPQITDVNEATTDVADCTREINEFLNWDLSMAKWTDLQGPMLRGNANFGFYTLPGLKAPNYTYRPQCAPGPPPIGAEPTPKFNGPPPTP